MFVFLMRSLWSVEEPWSLILLPMWKCNKLLLFLFIMEKAQLNPHWKTCKFAERQL